MKRIFALCFAAYLGVAHAQDGNNPELGDRPPARSISEAAVQSFTGVPGLGAPKTEAQQNDGPMLGAATSASATTVVEQPAVEPKSPRLASPRVEPARPARATVDIKPPPAEIDAVVGQNYVFGIATAHLNRILTPFADPMIKTTSTASISTEKGIIYVSTTQREPIAMFVHDSVDPEIAVSLTLMPSDIPPVSTRLAIKGYAKAQRFGVPRTVEAAQSFETSNDYVAMLSAIMADLALNKLPDGYGLMPVNGYPALMPECRWRGVDVSPRQALSGSAYTVFVALARNTGEREIELDESACAEPQVRAVSLWPRMHLAPGQETEVYVVVSAAEDVAPESVRPSLLGAQR